MAQSSLATSPDRIAERIQRGFGATMKGDVNALRSLYSRDFVCHVPGQCDLSGDLHGYDEVLRWFSQLLERSGGTFREESIAVVATDDWAFQLAEFRAERDGRKIEERSMNAYRIRDGRIAEVWGFFDTEAWDEFWSQDFDSEEVRRQALDYV